MKFRIDLKIFIIFIIFLITKQIHIYGYIMLFAILHELAHLVMGLILKMRPEKLELTPIGISISFELTPDDYNKKILKGNKLTIKKILVALAGPIANLIIIYIVLNLNINLVTQIIMIYSNILLVIVNLLPIYPLDGGRILEGIYILIFGRRKARKYINTTSIVFLILVTIYSSIAIIYVKNISIFLFDIFLWIIVIKEYRLYRIKEKIYQKINKELG